LASRDGGGKIALIMTFKPVYPDPPPGYEAVFPQSGSGKSTAIISSSQSSLSI
jgi:hypothetical protein